jgi:mono/diheme cytochrome c family protein
MNNSATGRIAGLLGAVLVAGSLCTEAAAQVFDEYSGAETFDRFCASCHGEQGRGDGPVAVGLPITVPDLSLLRKRQGDRFREATLRRIIDGREIVIYHGTRYMPVWGYEFWVEEGADEEAEKRVEVIIANLIDYIESIQRD